MGDRILVAYATKYGSTREIAERIAMRLDEQGFDTEMRPAGDAGSVEQYSAVVLGTPLYIGAMLRPASTFLERYAAHLNRMPLAVFASGPMYRSDGFEEPRKQLDAVLEKLGIHPATSEIFVGAYDATKLRGMDRMVAWMPASPLKGIDRVDERDWDAIDAWAQGLPALLGMRVEAQTAR